MRFLIIASLAAFLLLGTLGCDLEQPLAPDMEEEVLPSPTNRSAPGKKASSAGVDPFADSVVEDGVNDQGQGFPDPAGILGNLEVLDPAKSPPVTGLGIGGFAVVDMGEGEEITNGPGFDFLVVEADGSLLGAGFGGPEPFTVSVSNAPTGPFVDLGTSNGNGFFDLNGTGLPSARYVRLQDAGGGPPSGADLQGIAAFNFNGADFHLTPETIERDAEPGHVTGHLNVPKGFNVAAASIVLVAAIDQPSPTPPPYFSTLDIPGTLVGKGGVVKFDRAEFLDEAVDGDDIVVAVKLTSESGEVLYLFDLVNVRP